MSRNYNTTITRDAARLFQSKTADFLDVDVEKLIPVIEVGRVTDYVKTQTLTNGTAATIATTDPTLQTYITGVMLSSVQDATATNTRTQVEVIVGGASFVIARLAFITLTAARDTVSVTFLNPILVDPGSLIRIQATAGTANITAHACVFGYTVER